MRIFIPILLVLWTGFSGIQEKTVELTNEKLEGGVAIYGENRNIYPVTVEVELDIENLEPAPKEKVIRILGPNGKRRLMQFSTVDVGKEYGVKYNYNYYMGSILAKHDDRYAYRFPFKKGTTHRLDQGYAGDFSHYGSSTYALDFRMDEGTPVHAARDGLVVETESQYSGGGNNPEFMKYANNITILHEDGTFADYSHLQQNGVLVKPGDWVKAGEHIGFSGSTGYTTGPHLHFAVKKAVRGGRFVTLPVKFQTVQGILDELQEGIIYTSY